MILAESKEFPTAPPLLSRAKTPPLHESPCREHLKATNSSSSKCRARHGRLARPPHLLPPVFQKCTKMQAQKHTRVGCVRILCLSRAKQAWPAPKRRSRSSGARWKRVQLCWHLCRTQTRQPPAEGKSRQRPPANTAAGQDWVHQEFAFRAHRLCHQAFM